MSTEINKNEPELKGRKFTRREFLGLTAAAAAALLAGCEPTPLPVSSTRKPDSSPEPTGTPKPTDTPTAIPTKEVTPRPTETLAPNEVTLGSAVINPKLLEDGFGHLGGGEVVLPPSGADSATGGGAEQQTVDQLVARTNENWVYFLKDSFKFEDLGKISQNGDLIRLMTAISAGSGFDRTTYNLAKRFLALKDAEGVPLRLLPFQIFKVGTGSGVEEIDGWPQGNVIRDGTNITIVGQYVDEKGKDQYVLSYTEYLTRPTGESADVPRFNWLVVGREQFETLIGEANKDLPKGVSGLVLVGNKVAFTDNETNYSWEINTISPEIVKAVKDSAGFMRVDMIGDHQLAEKPIVPIPVGFDLPQEYLTSYDQETGVVSVYFKENGVLSEMPNLAASYDVEQKTWIWKEVITVTPENSPKIEGLVGKMDGEILKYYAEEGNKYGLEVGAWAGEYRPNVKLGSERVGGVVLAPEVALFLLNQKLDSIIEQSEKWMIVLPVDIRSTAARDEISVGLEKTSYGPIPFLVIKYPGQLPIVNNIPDTTLIRVVKDIIGYWEYYAANKVGIDCLNRICPGLEMHYNYVASHLTGFSQNSDVQASFGEKISDAPTPVLIYRGTSQGDIQIPTEKILSIDNTLVFIASK